MPRPFAPPWVEGLTVVPHTTYYQAVVGRGAAFEPGRTMRLTNEDFPDGFANTLLLVEASQPVLWTAPEDVAFDSEGPPPQVGGIFNTPGRFSLFGPNRRRGLNAAFVDGSVRFLQSELPQAMLRALLTRNGGEKVVNGD